MNQAPVRWRPLTAVAREFKQSPVQFTIIIIGFAALIYNSLSAGSIIDLLRKGGETGNDGGAAAAGVSGTVASPAAPTPSPGSDENCRRSFTFRRKRN
jgi:hypothetical protein